MINQVVLMGRLVAEPEFRTTTSGLSVVRFRVAVDRSFQKQGEERQADFIPCVAWRQQADFISKYFHKGQMIAVVGSLQSQSYEDKQTGAKRTSYEVSVDRASFCGSKAESGAGYSDSGKDTTSSYSNAGADDFGTVMADDDDLPF